MPALHRLSLARDSECLVGCCVFFMTDYDLLGLFSQLAFTLFHCDEFVSLATDLPSRKKHVTVLEPLKDMVGLFGYKDLMLWTTD